MKKKTFSILLWVLAVVLTLVFFVYQRLTGPTHPLRGAEVFQENQVSYKLLRSQTIEKTLPVKIKAVDQAVTAFINYKNYKDPNDHWKKKEDEIEMKREGDFLEGEIPGKTRMAAKIEYTVRVVVDNESFLINKGKSVVARFKGAVPAFWLIIHIILMFFSFIFALRTGMEALRKERNYDRLVLITLLVVFVGGMILGPIVQDYAFGDLWTGFPFGFDLTDNKTLIAFAAWLLAFFLKKKSRWWVLMAVVVMIIVYLIPHSVLGSEIDYTTGKMKNKYSIELKRSQDEFKRAQEGLLLLRMSSRKGVQDELKRGSG
ncbi:MAG: hypothetical protein KAW12_11400 [Candidatus Aminicenantes bacterium]|nr:hypothetical protein [Candidatus Aminicenantes bacterium]